MRSMPKILLSRRTTKERKNKELRDTPKIESRSSLVVGVEEK